MELQYEVVIVGAGPAGLTAAIYATRANKKTLVLESNAPGGKLVKTYEIENYPSVRKSSGVDLAMSLMEHGLAFGAEFDNTGVIKIEKNDGVFDITLTNNKIIKSQTVIVASGTRERTLPVKDSEKYTGRGISYCAVCDGAFYKGKDVIVIGGGNSALEESLYLTSLVNKVNIVIRRDQFRAEASIVERVLNNEKINVIYNSVADSLLVENDKVTGLKIKNVKDGSTSTVYGSAIFPYIGADAATEYLPKDILDENGYVITNEEMETSLEGMYAAGDVRVKNLRQVVTATSDGAVSANSAVRYLKSKNK